jgi:predicted nucleotidyltransferase component of viral defense system
MSVKIPNSRRNLDIAINRILGSSANPLQVRTVLANTIIGQLLPGGVVKGGSALKLRYGNHATRFTRDLDTARAEELSEFLDKLDAALKVGWYGFTGRIVRKEPAKPKNVPGEYIMQPFEIKLEYNEKSWVTVPLEIGHDEIGDTVDPDLFVSRDIVDFFEHLGFPAPRPIALMPIHHQIAQKLHAVSTERSERAHDLIDLQVIEKNEEINFSRTKNTCTRLFNSRKMQSWPPVIVKGNNWESLYNAQILGLDVLQTVDEAVDWVNDLIYAIEHAETKLSDPGGNYAVFNRTK